jgi:hypothetical protein
MPSEEHMDPEPQVCQRVQSEDSYSDFIIDTESDSESEAEFIAQCSNVGPVMVATDVQLKNAMQEPVGRSKRVVKQTDFYMDPAGPRGSPRHMIRTKSIGNVFVKESLISGAGNGLFASKNIPPFSLITVYPGEPVRTENFLKKKDKEQTYGVSLSNEWVIDAYKCEREGKTTEYLEACGHMANHRCSRGNASLFVYDYNDRGPEVWVRSGSKMIPKGEEIYVNYGTGKGCIKFHPCTCQQPKCMTLKCSCGPCKMYVKDCGKDEHKKDDGAEQKRCRKKGKG